jgi:hypothetical protein
VSYDDLYCSFSGYSLNGLSGSLRKQVIRSIFKFLRENLIVQQLQQKLKLILVSWINGGIGD